MFKFVKHLFLVAYIVILPFKLTGMYPEPSSSNFGIKKIGGIACIGGAATIVFCAAKPETATNYINQASNLIPYSWVTNAAQKSVQFLSEHPFISAGGACLLGSFGLYAITKQEKKSPPSKIHLLRKTPEEKDREKNRNIAWEYLEKEFPDAGPKNIRNIPDPITKKEENVEEKPKQPWQKINAIQKKANTFSSKKNIKIRRRTNKKLRFIKKMRAQILRSAEEERKAQPCPSSLKKVEDQVEEKQPPVLKQKNVTPRALEISFEGKSMPIISEKNSISQFIFEECMRPQLLQLATIPSEKLWKESLLYYVIKKVKTSPKINFFYNCLRLGKVNKPIIIYYYDKDEKEEFRYQLSTLNKEKIAYITQRNLGEFCINSDFSSKKTVIFDCTKSKELDIHNMIYKWVETWRSHAKRDASKDLILEKSIIIIATEKEREFIELARSQQPTVLQARQWAEGLSKEDESSKKPKPQRIRFAFCENQKRVDLIKNFLMLGNLPNITWIDSSTAHQTEEADSDEDNNQETNQLFVINSYQCDMHKIFRWIIRMQKQAIREGNQDPHSRTLLIVPLDFQKSTSILPKLSSKEILSLNLLINKIESSTQNTEIMYPIDDQNEKDILEEALKIYAELGKKSFSADKDTITIDQKIINLSEENLTAENFLAMMQKASS